MIAALGLLLPLMLPAHAESPVFALVNEFDRMAAEPLWPGFDARKVPLELFDGTDSYLVRHPAPPKEFKPVEGHPGFAVYRGRHASMRANTSVEVGGVMTATFGFERAGRAQAAVMVHECFHVYQGREHPSWTANEAVLFTYPVENAKALALARLETEAMSRALAAKEPECWAARVRTLRTERYSELPAEAAAYERGTEMHEGLAQYVEGLAAGRSEVRLRMFGPSEARQRGYATGEALARLLDRLSPGWQTKVSDSLDGLLPATGGEGCEFTRTETQSAAERARADVAKLEQDRAGLLRAFEAQGGWQVTVETAAGQPLGLDGFDPMNVERLSERLVLHKRWLKLHNGAGELEILNHGSVTEAAGAHLLFTGVRRWTTTGLADKPDVKQEGERVTLTSTAVKMTFTNAEVEMKAESVTIRLRQAR